MPFNDTLFQRLRLAKRPDLEALLADLKENPAKFERATDEDLIGATSAELRSAAGKSIRNRLRDQHEFSYKQILIDVADKLAPGRLSWTHFKISGEETEEQIEDYIYERLQVPRCQQLPPFFRSGVERSRTTSARSPSKRRPARHSSWSTGAQRVRRYSPRDECLDMRQLCRYLGDIQAWAFQHDYPYRAGPDCISLPKH